MALLKETFITEDAEDTGFQPIPAGNYTAKIIESDIKVTSAGNGEYIAMRWEVLDPEYAGRIIFSNLNIVNPNEKAVQIAKGFLKQCCQAAGIEELQDTQELHGIPMRITVKVRPPQNGYDAQNVISSAKALDDGGDEPWDE
jgi:hypothetical protein